METDHILWRFWFLNFIARPYIHVANVLYIPFGMVKVVKTMYYMRLHHTTIHRIHLDVANSMCVVESLHICIWVEKRSNTLHWAELDIKLNSLTHTTITIRYHQPNCKKKKNLDSLVDHSFSWQHDSHTKFGTLLKINISRNTSSSQSTRVATFGFNITISENWRHKKNVCNECESNEQWAGHGCDHSKGVNSKNSRKPFLAHNFVDLVCWLRL